MSAFRLGRILLLTLTATWTGTAQNEDTNTIALEVPNGGFERGAEQPENWRQVIHGQGFSMRRDTTQAHSGNASAALHGEPGCSDRACYLQTTPAFAPTPGLRLSLWYRGEGRANGILRLRPVDQRAGVAEFKTQAFDLPLPRREWTEFAVDVVLPAAARKQEQLRAEIILYQRGEGTVWYDDVRLAGLTNVTLAFTESQEPTRCPRRPENGRTVLQNPPDFWWPPQDAATTYTMQLSQDPAFPPTQTIEVTGLDFNVTSYTTPLAAGTWHWRTRFQDGNELDSEWSASWSFTVGDHARPFTVPPAAEMLARIPADHPRIYATRTTLAAFRAPLEEGESPWRTSFRERLERLVNEDIGREPPATWIYGDRDGGPLTDELIAQGNKLRSTASRITSRARDLAFGYLLSAETRYGKAAIEQLLEMAAWDPGGVTSYRNHDQVFRDITWKMAVVYDHCWDLMSDSQRATARNAIETRANVLYQHFASSNRPICAYPYNSHGITAYGFLGICAIALAHESAAADDWFRFVAATYPALFPPWGGEEGGWGQGVAYWKWSLPFAWWFFDALRSATGVDMYQKAWNRNTGWYKLYAHPPFNDRHHFGDGNHGPPGATDKANLARLAAAYGNPCFQWYADQVHGELPNDTYAYWWYDRTLPARPPADLPQGMLMPDIGWVAMHSDLSDPDTVSLLFKSSPYGSFNHSHGDQNHLVLYAFGEPLLIDSGYYDWYGSPHDKEWTRQTRAHNAILVNGEGQPIFDLTAKGRILKHLSTPDFDYACGDATAAYKGRLRRWQRHILYFPPDTFLIVDDLAAPQPAEYTWCLHAEQEMTLTPEANRVLIERGKARADVLFLEPDTLAFSQDDQFTPPPTSARPNEWHTYAQTVTKTTDQLFVTALRAREQSAAGAVLQAELTRNGQVRTITISRENKAPIHVTITPAEGDIPLRIQAQWEADGKPLTYSLPPLTPPASTIAALPATAADFPPPSSHGDGIPKLAVILDGKPIDSGLSHLPRYRGGSLLWGDFSSTYVGPVTLARTPLANADIHLNNVPVADGDRAFLRPRNSVQLRCESQAGDLQLALTPLLRDTRQRPCRVTPLEDPPANSILIEAETFVRSGQGTTRAYSHRPFLSGGKGIEMTVQAGQWTEWTFSVPQAGRFALLLKGAVFEEHADRLLEIDGQPLGGAWHPLRFPNTGGFGAIPEHWLHMQPCDDQGRPLLTDLAAGSHTLRLTALANKLNLDYLVLLPAE